jgi:hypothetical protein
MSFLSGRTEVDVMMITRLGGSSRKRVGVLGVGGILVVASLVVGIQIATADGGAPTSPDGDRAAPYREVAKEQLISGSTAFSSGYLSALAVPANTYTPVDGGVSIKCPGRSCTVFALAAVTAAGASGAGQFSICLYVDGALLTGCPFVGQTTVGAYTAFQWPRSAPEIQKGTHTLRTYAYSSGNSATLGFYSIQYEVYADK